MKHSWLTYFGRAAAVVVAAFGAVPVLALSISDTPLFLVGQVQPLVILDISKDQQLHKKAYNDYSDLNNDGQLETGYENGIDYYGYFDPRKCYTYSVANKRFEPTVVSADKYCSATGTQSTQWSGNFLNWAAMARIDAVRKLLYGGMRSQPRTNGDGRGIADGDTATSTVLERTFLPNDAHAWAKYYDGSDLSRLTPYTPETARTNSSTSTTITNSGANSVDYDFRVESVSGFSVNDYVLVSASSAYVKGQIIDINTKSKKVTVRVANANYLGSGTYSTWTLENLSTRGITLCNTTAGGSSPQDKSQTNTNLPLLRIARGNFSLWNANERWQCRWSAEATNPSQTGNGNDFSASGVAAAASSPALATQGSGTGLGDYYVRILACVPGLIGTERCKQYNSADASNLKPIGLLQVYGDADEIRFGLLTGSYDKSISGGVVRKLMGPFGDEVNVTSDGTFTSANGIVATLDRLRIYGYYYGDGSYLGGNGDNCTYGLTSLSEGSCTSWGNPMSELYLESLRYLTATTDNAARMPLYAYTNNTSSHDNQLGLALPSWTAAVTQTNYCASLNTLVFNASVSTTDIDLKDTVMTGINSSSTVAALANQVGAGEGIAGQSYFVGANGTSNDELCDAKTVANLGSIWGICPEGPSQLGSYLMPGMAYHAHTNRIRTDLTVPGADTHSLKVTTYGIQLATNVPRIPIALAGETAPRVILQPAFRLVNGSSFGGGTLVEMKVLAGVSTPTMASGTLYVNWEDSEQGGDYDQDLWGVVKYCLTTVAGGCSGQAANTVKITTDVVAESTSYAAGFGYTISGTTKDGAHFHSGIEGFGFIDSSGVLGCAPCQAEDSATTVIYSLSGNLTANVLQDPLYYAAKWGGFNDLDGDGRPTSTQEWDVLTADGSPGSDGIPDNYFFVNNPLGLETALNSVFLKILTNGAASSIVANSSALNTKSRIYQGRFNSYFWSGQLLSYRLDRGTGGVLSANLPPPGWDPAESPYPEWDAGQEVREQADVSSDTRAILTRTEDGVGVGFAYANLSESQKAALDTNSQAIVDMCGIERVGYLRGQSANEGAGTFTCANPPANTIAKFRNRATGILGDIINAKPVLVGKPAAGFADVDHPGYAAFASRYAGRAPVVYVGSNDGMLHGFDASVDVNTNTPTTTAGKELLAYVPSAVYANLSRLTDSRYLSGHRYFVDGSGMMADACITDCTSAAAAQWKTVLIGGLGAGGKGFYALDVTNPSNFTVPKADEVVLWEFTSSDDEDLGLTYNSAPTDPIIGQAKQIAKFQNGRWGVIVGNGYNSANGKAVLYVLFLSGPTGFSHAWLAADYVKIEADAGPDNGLSTPVPIDSNGDGLVDKAYAGDLRGNVWRFDLSARTPRTWGKSLLFAAGTSQPITVAPTLSLHPAAGVMVLVGTGKYLEKSDNSTDIAGQTYYGIQDVGSLVSKAELTPMVVTTTRVGTQVFRGTAAGCGDPPETACAASAKGWYLDLPAAGERPIGAATLIRGMLFFNTLIPSAMPCEFGGTGYLMAVNYLTGAPLGSKIFDSNGDGAIDGGDIVVVGAPVGAALGGTTVILGNATGGAGVGVSSLTSGEVVTTKLNLGGGAAGRLNWREIVN
ncbi:PilC/PilY family type IV pilus protein [uncultured Thiodictyon sp.]|uniref:pilus assembly protein n=1 Tax=uncultured Thiodictyon sp. TaxID=1846217 RepID=UPI0025CF90A3|nr:PilC/PilY family type IV pilus protein [uncultured Thiodictyon sp.]